jgi:hypothetical protein
MSGAFEKSHHGSRTVIWNASAALPTATPIFGMVIVNGPVGEKVKD